MHDTSANTSTDIAAALAMLDAFASVGTLRLDVTLTDLDGVLTQFQRGVALSAMRHSLPDLLARSARQQENIIVRPYTPPTFLQLDDLDAHQHQRVQPAAFLCLETSPGSFQAWLALREHPGADYVRGIRAATNADLTASGAARLAGTRNFKRKYAPAFPLVQIAATTRGLFASHALLDELGVQPADLPPRVSSPLSSAAPGSVPTGYPASGRARGAKPWPSYARCVAAAPAKRDQSGPDISRADFTWCLIALDWGWSMEDTAAHLLEESSKARENGEKYARLTTARAQEALTRRRGTPHNAP